MSAMYGTMDGAGAGTPGTHGVLTAQDAAREAAAAALAAAGVGRAIDMKVDVAPADRLGRREHQCNRRPRCREGQRAACGWQQKACTWRRKAGGCDHLS